MTDDPIRPSPGEGASAFRVSSRSPAGERADERSAATARGGRAANVPDLAFLEELAAFLVTALAILIASAIADDLGAGLAWTLIAVIATGFILSRGLAKRQR